MLPVLMTDKTPVIIPIHIVGSVSTQHSIRPWGAKDKTEEMERSHVINNPHVYQVIREILKTDILELIMLNLEF